MARRGRPRASTETQREQVRRLAAEGRSRRQIAEDVFGDARFRGRVERILGSTLRELPGAGQLSGDGLHFDGQLADDTDGLSLRHLVNRYRESLAARDETPSLSEIERLLRIERQLAAMEQVEQLNALTRDRGRGD